MPSIRWYPFLALMAVLLASCKLPQLPPPGTANLSPSFQPSVHNRVAVLMQDHTNLFGPRTRNHGVLRQMETELMGGIIGKGYTVPSRSDVEQLLQEMRLQEDRITEDAATRLGRLLNVPAVLLVDVNAVSVNTERVRLLDGRTGTATYARASASARLIGVDTGEVLWTASTSRQTRTNSGRREEQLPLLLTIARNLVELFPSRIGPGAECDMY